MKEVVQKAEELALSEIEKYGLPSKYNFETSNKKGLEIAEKLSVDKDIVQIGTRLMDLKLGQAFSEKRLKDHVKMSVSASNEFLSQFNLPENMVEKILNCVEGHHKDVPWICKEAEVAANADCYRFLLTKNCLIFLSELCTREMSFEESLKYAESKADEKWNILSLDICKKELELHYKIIKEIVKKATT